MQKSDALKQMDAAISAWDALLRDIDSPNNPYYQNAEDKGLEVATMIAEAIRRFAPPSSDYISRLNHARTIRPISDGLAVHLDLIGPLRALRAAYARDYLATVVELVHADTFSDLLDQAEYLLEQRYKDAAAVIVGGVLEEHIRKLCSKSTIAINDANSKPLKATILNDSLKAANVYGTLEHKNVNGWQDLRNKAAHGQYTAYDEKHVEVMLMGVRNFVATYPA